MHHAVRYRDVLRGAAAEAEHRPARAEVRVGHRHVFAASEQRARVVLRLDGAVADRDVLAADEVKPIVVVVYAVEDVQPVDLHVLRLDDAHAVIRTAVEPHIADAHVRASMKQHVIRATIPADSTRRRRSARCRMKLNALPVDQPRPIYRDVLRVHGKKQRPVAVAERRVAGERDRVHRMVLRSVRAAEQCRGRGQIEGEIAPELERADVERALGHEHRSTALGVTSVDGLLHGGGIERRTVAFRSVIANIVDARAAGPAARGNRGRHSSDHAGAERRDGHVA